MQFWLAVTVSRWMAKLVVTVALSLGGKASLSTVGADPVIQPYDRPHIPDINLQYQIPEI